MNIRLLVVAALSLLLLGYATWQFGVMGFLFCCLCFAVGYYNRYRADFRDTV